MPMEGKNVMPVLLEVCIEDTAGLNACVTGGADRIELCSALDLGGLTPSAGLMRAAARLPIPTFAMVRPRAGDFRFSAADVAVMRTDIAAARAAGLTGVVLGALTGDGTLDLDLLRVLVAEAEGLERTLHRAVDLVPDRLAAVDQAVGLGFHTILTSGGALRAPDGADAIRAMRERADGRIAIMAGSGIGPGNAASLIRACGVTAIHASCGVAEPPPPDLSRFGFAGPFVRRTDPDRIRALKTVLSAFPD
jgi:copper homeostasis protein